MDLMTPAIESRSNQNREEAGTDAIGYRLMCHPLPAAIK